MKRKFSAEEDATLISLVGHYGLNHWDAIASAMQDRSPRQVRERWQHYLSPTLNRSEWTREEDALLLQKYQEFGAKWKKMERYFCRSDISIKNRFLLLSRRERKRIINQMIKDKRGVSTMPPKILPALVPLVSKIERVETITPSFEIFSTDLTIDSPMFDDFITVDEWDGADSAFEFM